MFYGCTIYDVGERKSPSLINRERDGISLTSFFITILNKSYEPLISVPNGLGANIYAIRPYKKPAKLEDSTKEKTTPKQEVQTTTSMEQPPAPTTLFERMKTMLSSTIGKDTLARRFFGVYHQQTLPMLKFSIHKHKAELFEQLGIQALHIAIQTKKRKNIPNLPGYYSGILRELIDKALFSNAFKDYDMPVEGLYWQV